MNQFFIRRKLDYRHIICTLITLISLVLGIYFPNSLPRLAESLRDIGTSVLYYIIEYGSNMENTIEATIMLPQSWKFAAEIWKPISFLPSSWDEFLSFWSAFCDIVFNEYNFLAYCKEVRIFIYNVSRAIMLLFPLFVFFVLRISSYKDKHCCERGKKSKQLVIFERFYKKRIYPVITWIKEFVKFVSEHSYYLYSWLIIWLMHFNLISIFISFIAFYFYLCASWDFIGIYTQLLKLQLDLTPMIRFLPLFIWVLLFVLVYDSICRAMAYSNLYQAEKANTAVLSERGVSTVVFGEMGVGKTQLITSLSITAEIKLFCDMFNTMLKYDHFFPNFPWQTFRDELKLRIGRREIYNLASCRQCISRWGEIFEYITSHYTLEEYKLLLERYPGMVDRTLGYDYEHYRTSYNDELKITKLFEAAEEYACAYYVFTIETTLIYSNYSIRLDSILHDIGNMPLRDNDLFHRDPKLQESYSRHAHIIDMNMIRLGKQILKDGEKSKTLMPGVYVISEIDKERKNMLELKETKINVDEANQKNDLFNAGIMMSRHSNVVDFIPVIYFFFDLQRPEAWGAGGRELGEVIYISDKSDMSPVLPFFSPYWITQGIFSIIRDKWNDFYQEYIYNRSDETLFVYLVKNIMSAIGNHYDKIEGLFGMQTQTLEIQSGRLDGNVKNDKWRLLAKKDRSNRYRTDCLKGVFESHNHYHMHIDDFRQYCSILATSEELGYQRSFFQDDIKKMKGTN